MATVNQNQRRLPENLRKQLALAARSIQWSYAIFWSISDEQPGMLEWGDGFYNGDIKTRKTVQVAELNADQLGLQRSDQLKELYESLALGETSPQPKRPTAVLSPEDLTDAEWLPGRTLEKNGTIWLRNAHRADTEVFSRSLLAKSASLQTVVCFPHFGGVIELGTTEIVPEDLTIIERIKTSFLESPSDIVSKTPNQSSNDITQTNYLIDEVLDHASMPEKNLDENFHCQDVEVCSPNNCSDDFADNLLREESNLVDGSLQFKDDAISNGPNNSLSSSDSVSQTHGNPQTNVPLFDGKKASDNCMHDGQECNQQKHTLSGFNGNDIHYQSVLTSLLKSSHQLILGPCRNGSRKSSFIRWEDRKLCCQLPQAASSQRLLKKVLFEIAKMHENFRIESAKWNDKKEDLSRRETEEVDRNHVLSERKRREKINERFMILGSLVPSGGKVDKVSILDHTIEHLRELERKVEELQSCKEVMELELMTQSKLHEAIERTSDNDGPNKIGSFRKLLKNKRKACDTEKMAAGNKRVNLSSSTGSITVNLADKDVLIDIRCSWRESLLLEVMEAINKLHLESQTIQSSNTDRILSMSIKATSKGLKGASAGVIKQALQKVIRKC